MNDIEKIKINYILEKLSGADIKVITDKNEYQWMKDQIDEINITLNMLEEKPLQMQFNEKKEIEELSTSYNDTQARSQSLKPKIILDSSNSQEFINNLNFLSNTKNKIDSKEFLSSLKKAFYLDDTLPSNYVHNKNNNIELRLSNHCANAISSKKYDKSTSIVIKLVRGKNAPKFRKSPEADLIEFAYYPENLTLESEKAIVNGLIDWVNTGEYTNTQADEIHKSTRKDFVKKHKPGQKMIISSEYEQTCSFVTDKSGFVDPEKITAVDLYGLEKAKEMWKDGEPDWNTRMMLQDKALDDYFNWKRPVIHNYKDNDNLYGFTYEGKIYLNPDIMNSEVAVHEYTHLWDNYTQKTNPELWEKGKSIFKDTYYWNEVKSDPNYADITDNDDLILSEIHSRICGKISDKILERIAETDGKITKDKAIDWDKETWDYIYKSLHISVNHKMEKSGNSYVDLKDFLSMPMKDLMNEKKITQNLDSNSVIQKYTSNEKGDKSMSYNDITKNDIEFLKKLGCSIDKKNLDTLSFIKNYFLPEKKQSSLDEKHLYTMLVMEGFNNPKSKNHSKLAEKLCGIYQNSDSQKKCLNSRLLVLGYINENIKNQKLSNEERIKNLKAIKEKLEKQQGNFISLIKNENISPEYKKVIIERALKYNLAQPQKETVIKMASDKAPLYTNKLVNNYSRVRR